MTAQGVAIEALSVPAQSAQAPLVVVLGALDGSIASTRVVQQCFEDYANAADNFVDVLFVPRANPDAVPLLFPPNEPAYATNWTAWSLWRWLAVTAPDLVLIAGNDEADLANLLSKQGAGLGTIPAQHVSSAEEIIQRIRGKQTLARSPARQTLLARQQRTPRAMADKLSTLYGQQLGALTYIPAMALIGRLRMGHVKEVERIVEPSLATADTIPITSSLQIAGHLLYAELAERTRNPRYLQIAKRAADMGWDKDGNMLEVMPFHGDYSDAFFMETPLLAWLGKLTGETRYFDMALRHVNYMHKELIREDGLYNHWPRAQAAWGRGNAFAALGFALALSELPTSHAAHARVRELCVAHVNTLLAHVDADGMWHNVINVKGSWPETSATTMIATAIKRGIARGWLDRSLQGVVDSAWQALMIRSDDNGGFLNVCESTVGQESFEAYLNRKALSGRDDRQGGMMLMLATELLA